MAGSFAQLLSIGLPCSGEVLDAAHPPGGLPARLDRPATRTLGRPAFHGRASTSIDTYSVVNFELTVFGSGHVKISDDQVHAEE